MFGAHLPHRPPAPTPTPTLAPTSNPSHSNPRPNVLVPHPSASATGHRPKHGTSTWNVPSNSHRGRLPSTSSTSSFQVPVPVPTGEIARALQRTAEHVERKAARRTACLAAGFSERDADTFEEARGRQVRELKGYPAGAPQQRVATPTDPSGSQGGEKRPTCDWSLLELVRSESTLIGSLAQMRATGGRDIEKVVTPKIIAALQSVEPTLGARRNSGPTGKGNETVWRALAFDEWCQWCAVRGIAGFPIVGAVVACFLRDALESHRPAFIYILEQYREVTHPIFAALVFSKPARWTDRESVTWRYVTTQGSKPLVAWKSIQEINSSSHSPIARTKPPSTAPSVLRPAAPLPQPSSVARPPPTPLHPSSRLLPPVSSHVVPAPPTQMSAKAQGKRREVDPVPNERPSKRPHQDTTLTQRVKAKPTPTALCPEQVAFSLAITGLSQAMVELANLRGMVLRQGVGSGGVVTSKEQMTRSREVSGSKKEAVARPKGEGGSQTREVSTVSTLAKIPTRPISTLVPFTVANPPYPGPPAQSYSFTVPVFLFPYHAPFSLRPIVTARPVYKPAPPREQQPFRRWPTNDGKTATPGSFRETIYQFSPQAQARPRPLPSSLPNPPHPLSSSQSLDTTSTTATTTDAGSTSSSSVTHSNGAVLNSSSASSLSNSMNLGVCQPILPSTLPSSPPLKTVDSNLSPSLLFQSSTVKSESPIIIVSSEISKHASTNEESGARVGEIKMGSVVTSLASPPPDNPIPVGHHQLGCSILSSGVPFLEPRRGGGRD